MNTNRWVIWKKQTKWPLTTYISCSNHWTGWTRVLHHSRWNHPAGARGHRVWSRILRRGFRTEDEPGARSAYFRSVQFLPPNPKPQSQNFVSNLQTRSHGLNADSRQAAAEAAWIRHHLTLAPARVDHLKSTNYRSGSCSSARNSTKNRATLGWITKKKTIRREKAYLWINDRSVFGWKFLIKGSAKMKIEATDRSWD